MSDWVQLYFTVKMGGRVRLNVSVCAIFLTIGTFLLTFHQTNQLDSNDLQVDHSLSNVKANNHQTEILNELYGELVRISTTAYSDYNNLYLRK